MKDELWALLGVAFAAFMLGFIAGKGHAATSACAYQQGGVLPDAHCTPGATNPAVTQGDIGSTICKPGWSTMVRHQSGPSIKDKLAAMGQYGIGSLPTGTFEYDHLVPLELGGAVNDPRNLWPEYFYLTRNGQPAGARVKDTVENVLHEQVCAGTRTLRSAQIAIAHDWSMVLQ